jgi:arginyl-tRNA synthetase
VTPADLAVLVRAAATDVLRGRGLAIDALPARVDLARPRDPTRGDYTTSVALRSARRVGVTPAELAAWLVGDLGGRPGIASAEVAGPGFVNLRLAAEARGGLVGEVLAAGRGYGTGGELAGRSVSLVTPTIGPVRPTGLRAARAAVLVDAMAGLLIARGASVQHAGPDVEPKSSTEAVSDAVRYALLRVPAGASVELDLELLASPVSENRGYVVRYAHACLAGALRQGTDLGMSPGAGYQLLDRPEEAGLIGALGDYPEVVRAAADPGRPDRLARYLEELVGAYHRFADACRVLPMGDEAVTERYRARLALCAAARQVLGNGLGLLGVTAPERL